MGEPPCTELAIRRAMIVEIALGVVSGSATVSDAAREIAMLRIDIDPGEEDADLVAMDAIATGRDVPSTDRASELFARIATRYGSA
jgi:hypothetical protein